MSEDGSGRCTVTVWLVRLIVFFGFLAPLGAWAWLSLYQYKENVAIAASHETLGDEAYSRKDFSQAIIAYERAAAKMTSFHLQVKLAGVRMGMLGNNPDLVDAGQAARIEQDVEWLKRQDPNSVSTCTAVLGHLEMMRGRPRKAEARYAEALKGDPDCTAAHIGMAILYKSQKKLAEAAKEYENVLSKLPDHFNTLMALAEVRLDSGDSAGGLELLEKAQESRLDWRIHMMKGLAYADMKKADKAEKEYMTAISLNPKSFDAHRALGNLYFNAKLFDRAVNSFREALKIQNDEGVASGLASALRELKRPMECLHVLDPYLRNSEVGPTPLAIAGRCAEALKQPEQARALYTATVNKIKELGKNLDEDAAKALENMARQGLDRLKEGSK